MTPAGELQGLLLAAPRLTIAAAESLTAGRVQALIASVSGASEYFAGGLTAYNLEQKVRHLGVDRAHAAAVRCVSPRVAAEMAAGALALFRSDLAVATTGYAEPSEGVPAPMAFWALARNGPSGPEIVRSGRVEFPGAARDAAQERVAAAVVVETVAWLRAWRAGA